MEARTDFQYYSNLLQKFSLITIGENKVPNFAWKNQQTTKFSEEEFYKRYTDLRTKGVGIVTGFEDLETIDIDTKVFFNDPIQEGKSLNQQTEEKDAFVQEYFQTLRDHIEDFDQKVVIYQTRSGGFHIIYKARNIEGNLKLAKLQGYKEALCETRSKGGYIFIYKDNQVSERSYFEVDYITDDERNIIIQVSQLYDYKKPSPIAPAINAQRKTNVFSKNPSWTDYNNKTNVWNLISSEFHIISDRTDMIVIRRNGSKAQWSGYIYRDSGCLFLFSTGTIYPAETLLSPFQVLAYQKYNGDMVETARQLYFENYGDRIEPNLEKPQKKHYRRKYFFSEEVFKKTLTGHQENSFLKFLEKKDIPEKLITGIIEDYYLGTLIDGELKGAVTFPFIDEYGRINAVLAKNFSGERKVVKAEWLHIILYNHHHEKDSIPEWLQVYLQNDSFINCLFGMHLLKQYPDKRILIVEWPEDAILGSLRRPECLWMASGKIVDARPEIFRKLKGRNVSFIPHSQADVKQLESVLFEVEVQEEVRITIGSLDEILIPDEAPARQNERTSPSPANIMERINIGLSFSDEDLQGLAERLIPECDSRTETEIIMALKEKEGLNLQDSIDLINVMRVKNVIDVTSHKSYFLFNSTPF